MLCLERQVVKDSTFIVFLPSSHKAGVFASRNKRAESGEKKRDLQERSLSTILCICVYCVYDVCALCRHKTKVYVFKYRQKVNPSEVY